MTALTSARSTSARLAGPGRTRHLWRTALIYLVLTVALLGTMLPFVWMVLGSVKTEGELMKVPITWWPETFTWDNFGTWFTTLDFPLFLGNSVIVAVFVVVGNLLFCSMVGYALAKMDFPGKKPLFIAVLAMLMVPGVVTMIPLFVLIANMGLVNTHAGLILPFLAAPFGVFLMRQFMFGIPDELIEAARIDGASEMRIFARIVIPMCGPALATLAIFTFLASWNNFLWPLIVAQSGNMYTLPVALSLYSAGKVGPQYGIMMAGAVLIILPIIVLFLFLQRYFVAGLATSGLK